MHPFLFFSSPDPKSKVIILSVILKLPLSVRGVGRRTQSIRTLLNDLLITTALNPTCLVQSALNPTCLLQVSDFPTPLLLDLQTK
jgi:hypothetical protein